VDDKLFLSNKFNLSILIPNFLNNLETKLLFIHAISNLGTFTKICETKILLSLVSFIGIIQIFVRSILYSNNAFQIINTHSPAVNGLLKECEY